jgi:hypothetical protein
MALTQANSDVISPILSGTTSGTLASTDAGKMCLLTGGITVNASTFNVGDTIVIYNTTSSSITITSGSGTIRLAGTLLTGNRTLSAYGMATILCVVSGASAVYIINGSGLS